MIPTWKQTAIRELAEDIAGSGLRVFVSGTCGFFTNKAGDRLVDFRFEYLSFKFGGNYCRKNYKAGQNSGSHHGDGWTIPVDLAGEVDWHKVLNTPIPVGTNDGDGVPFRHMTVDEYLASGEFFGLPNAKSKYKEVLPNVQV